MASIVGESCSGTTSKPVYNPDVFLSFAGKDVRHGFVAHLYSALCRKGIKAFRDDKTLRKGQPFATELLKAIEESKISIIVLSEGYWFSKWCLNELVKIHQCTKNNQRIFPIFYKVEPSDLRDETRFEIAMKNINEKQKAKKKLEFSAEQMKEWRNALLYAGSLEGYPLQEGSDESEFIERFVTDIFKVVPKLLDIGQHIVGLKSSIEKVKSLLDIGYELFDNPVRMLLIHGIGGIGKTTLAKALFNEIVDQFEGASFLSNVREDSLKPGGLASLQKILLKEAIGEDIDFSSDGVGVYKIKQLLCNKRILLILDDVDDKEHLKKLAGGCDWFGSGSKIIITSRDKELIKENQVNKKYEMKELNDIDALECFCWNCFNNSQPRKGFENFSDLAVKYAKGLPLALEIIASDLSGEEDFKEWEKTLRYYESNQHQGILVILRRSYDRLGFIEKRIFLDIACFFKGKKKEYVQMGCERAVTILIGKSLVTVKSGILGMHDLIQQMGRQIVLEENNVPGKCSRLWHHEHVYEVLTLDTGTDNIEGLMLASGDNEQELRVEWRGTAFEKMNNLRILIVKNAIFSDVPTHLPNNLRWLEWDKYPSATLPQASNINKLVFLALPLSQVSELRPLKGTYLSYLNLSRCLFLREIPCLSGFPNLRELILSGCENLTKVDDSIGLCSKLVHLDLSRCTQLEIFPRRLKMPSLEYFDLCFCQSLQHFPDIQGEIKTLQSIKLVDVKKVKMLPESLNNITGLKVLFLLNCPEVEELPVFKLESLQILKIWKCSRVSFRKWRRTMRKSDPGSINFPNLHQLSIYDCNLSDEDLDTMLTYFPKLECLELCANIFKSIPECIEDFVHLQQLDVSFCSELQNIPKLPPMLHKVTALECCSLTSESRSVLWSQACRKVDGLEIVFELSARRRSLSLWTTPRRSTSRRSIPKWSIPSEFRRLYHDGGLVSFQTSQTFPFAAFAFVMQDDEDEFDDYMPFGIRGPQYENDIAVQVFINGCLVNEKRFTIKTDRVVLVDVRNCEKNTGADAFLVRDCNDVDVRFKTAQALDQVLQVYGVPCELQMNRTSI